MTYHKQSETRAQLCTNEINASLTLIPLGYFDHLSPLGGGGADLAPPPSDLGN